MCGIAGFNWDNKDLVKSMIKVLQHRGPDQGGVFTDSNISLGHRRLSIIDLSTAASQPMPNEDGSIILVYNGEIYNFLDLKTELIKLGHRFRSNSDSEVIVHGYEQWGPDVVSKLNGQFAFCIYDQPNKKMFLARDRLGIKPLYYFWNGKKFIFASEIKAILQAPVPRLVNLHAAKMFLNLRYVPGAETMFQGIQKLLPGHSLTLHQGNININQFWHLPFPKIEKVSNFQGGFAIKEILTDSIKKRLIADVPVGIYLSGGIDSATITAIASRLKNEQNEEVKTFSVGFNYNYEVDELHKAKAISEHFNTNHHEITVSGNISKLLPKLIWHLDMPHGDPVIIPQYKLSELASKKVKVVLSGEGTDEIFAGYVQYKNFLQAQKIQHLPFKSKLAKKASITYLDKFFDYPSSIGEKGKEKLIDFLENLKKKEESYTQLTSILSTTDNSLLFTGNLKDTTLKIPSFENRKPMLNQLLAFDTSRWLPNYVLYINDRMTMANSIEGRTPFLDHRLVEYSTTLPSNLKLRKGVTKFVLREGMRKILPNVDEKKHAFFMPLDKWYKDELKWLAEELFTPAKVKERGYFNYYYIKKIWENYNTSKLLYGKQLFTLLNFELWHRMFIDGDGSCVELDKLL
jgi:asparagine synthase (glutamine-hydrolysing)